HAEHLVVSPDGAYAYVAVADDAVMIFARDGGTGLLTPAGVTRNGEGDVPLGALRAPISIALSPDGTELYMGCVLGTLSVFARDAGTGALAFVETQHQEGSFNQLLVSADGKRVYVAQ